MSEQNYKALNAELGAEFDLFAIENPEWIAAQIPPGATVVMQTADRGFNAWALSIAQRNRRLDDPSHPVVLIHIRELRPVQSRIVRAEAELLTA